MTKLNDFLGELASDSPTPGGGSVAALCGALGAALNSMVANLTIGKKKYADVEAEMQRNLADTETLRVELAQMIEEDAAAFDRVMVALRMPKETDEEKAAAFSSIIVNSGTYTLSDSLLTTFPTVAKTPEFIGGRATSAWRVSGDTLRLDMTDCLSSGGVRDPGVGVVRIPLTLVRVE